MTNSVAYEFPERLNRWIKLSGLTEASFAEKVALTDNTVRNFCEGKVLPNLKELRAIAFCTRISADWWLGLGKLPEDGSEYAKLKNAYSEVVHENAMLHSKVYDLERKLDDAEGQLEKMKAEYRVMKSNIADRFISILTEA